MSFLNKLGLGVTSRAKLQWLLEHHQSYYSLGLLEQYPGALAAAALPLLRKTTSQYRQDLFALLELGFKRDGYFVEFGAADGVDGSNTLLLEREFGWHGVLAEPAKVWHESLRETRRCDIDTRCVWSRSGERLQFDEANLGQLSTVRGFGNGDRHAIARGNGTSYTVESVSLLDLLDSHNAPREIDFLSIDTEGSEYRILSSFDFSKYSFHVLVCEHNYTSERDHIAALMESQGYRRKFPELSQTDDWYVRL